MPIEEEEGEEGTYTIHYISSFIYHENTLWFFELQSPLFYPSLLYSNSILYPPTPSLPKAYLSRSILSLLQAFPIYLTVNFIIFWASTHFLLNSFPPSLTACCVNSIHLLAFNNKPARCLLSLFPPYLSFLFPVLMFRLVSTFFCLFHSPRRASLKLRDARVSVEAR